MLETIFYKILQRIETKQRESQKWTGRICPKIKKKLDKYFEWSNECRVTPASNYLYAVSSHEFEQDYSVDFNTRACSCKRWQLSGIPCHHAIACCRKDRINQENLVHFIHASVIYSFYSCKYDLFIKSYTLSAACPTTIHKPKSRSHKCS
jgi:hypothetical protein